MGLVYCIFHGSGRGRERKALRCFTSKATADRAAKRSGGHVVQLMSRVKHNKRTGRRKRRR